MINVNKPHPRTLERQLTDGEEKKTAKRKKKVEEGTKKGHLSFFFSPFSPRVSSISNYHRR
jgi:hypothetical protein